MKKLLQIVIILSLVFVSNTSNYEAKAQGPLSPVIDTALPCSQYQVGVFYRTPRYDYTPVLFTYMPYDVMIGYIGFDSVIANIHKTYPSSAEIRDFVSSLKANNDTFLTALKY